METVSAHTKKAYDAMWAWVEETGLDVNQPEDVLEAIALKWPNLNTRKTKLAYLIGFLKKTPEFSNEAALKAYQDKLANLVVEFGNKKVAQEATEKEKNNWLSWAEVQTAAFKMKKQFYKSLTDLENAILVSLYTDMVPTRNDYSFLGFDEKSPNWINLWTGDITIREHKTAKTEGELKRTVPLTTLVMIHLLLEKDKTRKTLFLDTEANLSTRLIRLFEKYTEKKIGSTMLRHIYLTEQQKGEKTIVEKQELAKSMGHCVQTQAQYRRPELE